MTGQPVRISWFTDRLVSSATPTSIPLSRRPAHRIRHRCYPASTVSCLSVGGRLRFVLEIDQPSAQTTSVLPTNCLDINKTATQASIISAPTAVSSESQSTYVQQHHHHRHRVLVPNDAHTGRLPPLPSMSSTFLMLVDIKRHGLEPIRSPCPSSRPSSVSPALPPHRSWTPRCHRQAFRPPPQRPPSWSASADPLRMTIGC